MVAQLPTKCLYYYSIVKIHIILSGTLSRVPYIYYFITLKSVCLYQVLTKEKRRFLWYINYYANISDCTFSHSIQILGLFEQNRQNFLVIFWPKAISSSAILLSAHIHLLHTLPFCSTLPVFWNRWRFCEIALLTNRRFCDILSSRICDFVRALYGSYCTEKKSLR